VTGIVPVRKGWVRVEAGRLSWMLPVDRAPVPDAVPGADIDPESLDALEDECQPPAARRDALRHLAGSERTCAGLTGYLAGRGYAPRIVEAAVSWARANRFVDDGRYAAAFVDGRAGRSPMGSARIRLELRRRGVPDGEADSVLRDRDDEDQIDALVETVRRRYGGLPRETAFRRAAGYLSRRGFSTGLALRVIARAFRDGGEGPG